ncbi:MAG: glycosyltransferase family 9 protein [Deltaproteobacteria bacterium]|nr:glycosyltransferase family 9 protein [Deltaproteobacteria bacterium]
MTFAIEKARRILVHKPDRGGDALCAAPAIARLAGAAPEAELWIATTRSGAAFLRALNITARFRELSGPAWWKGVEAFTYPTWARSMRFDLAVNLRYDFRDIAATRLLGARAVATYTHKNWGRSAQFPAPSPREDRSEIENHLEVAAAIGFPVGHDVAPWAAPESALHEAREKLGAGRATAFHPFAGTPAKTLPDETARRVLEILLDTSDRVALIGGPESQAAAARLAETDGRVVNLVGRTSAAELLAVLAVCRLLVSTDSAPGHAARAVGTPVVSLMSGTNEPARWAPRGARVVRHAVACAPCHAERCRVAGHPCLADLPVDAVGAAVAEAMIR